MTQPRTLIIGYGNELRGDDAAGVVLAKAIAALKLPGVQVLTATQLFPEMSAEAETAQRVLFCDAALGLQRPRWRALLPAGPGQVSSWCGSHVQDPVSLLHWTWLLYERRPAAWWIQLPAVRFGLGDSLSSNCLIGVQCAERQLKRLLAKPAEPISCMSSA